MEMEPRQVSQSPKVGVLLFAVAGLGLVYLFQRFNYSGLFFGLTGLGIFEAEEVVFIVNRTARLLLNDALCVLVIWGLFQSISYLKLAWLLFLFELLVLLPAYLFLKLNFEGTSEISSPLLSPIHRMIVNPLLMIILIGAFYYQRYITLRSGG